MKKFLLGLSMMFLVIGIIFSWFSGSFGFALGMSLVLVVLLALNWVLYPKHATIRTWVVILLLFVSAFMLGNCISKITVKRPMPNEITPPVSTQEPIKESVEKSKEELTEEVVEDTIDETVVDPEPQIIEKTVTKVVKEEVPVEKVIKVPVEVPVEKVIEVPVEVPVEKVVEVPVEKIVEVPVVEHVKVTPKPTPNHSYTGNPVSGNYNSNYGYTGDPTGVNYNNHAYGDPTRGYSTSRVKITGAKNAVVGNEYTYTINGANNVSTSKLDVPNTVDVRKCGHNQFRLTFNSIGSYFIGYEGSEISVRVEGR